jgi:murein DD-endopeptidase MepM/ murein hydrolase activator NlpD
MHQGIDFAAAMGQPVVAAASGTVVSADWAGGYGRQVRIAHAGGLTSSYSHLSRFAVGAAGHVSAGQVIGYAGSSGLSTGPHVHFEIRRNGRAIDPTGASLAGGTILSPAVAAKVQARMDALLRIAPQPRG